MIKVGIVGISGYSGKTAFSLLLNHPLARITYVSANNTKGKVSEIWPEFLGKTDLACETFNLDKAIELCDILILAVPHTVSLQITPELLKAKKRIIDLSGDYRLRNKEAYKKWYGAEHADSANLKAAVYGLPELYRQEIKKADLVSNPGCYPTAAILALAPIIATQGNNINSVIIDAKSGVTGAGKKVTANLMFAEVNENFKAYKVLNHQHSPEINQYLSKLANSPVDVTFVPHLLPINNGILETIYIQMKQKITLDQSLTLYTKFYKTEPFVRILPKGVQPEIKNVVGTNYCDLGFAVDENKNLLVITSAIDNLLKGASGQAVQNLNIMYGFEEVTGLS